MNWRRALIVVAVLGVLIVAFYCASDKIARLTAERDRYRENTDALLEDIKTYRTKDSLSAAQVKTLELTLDEYKRYRAEDARLIKTLQAKNRDLSDITSAQAQTIIELQARPRDTVIIRDSVSVPAKAVHCGDAWYDFNGVLTDDDFTGKVRVRDSLVIVETVKYKRCWFFKTRKVKDRQVDCLSKNPYVEILGVERIKIEK